jgi:hypothetical protein
MTMAKYTMKKYMGDDMYSWAIFKDGRLWTSGMSRNEARWLAKELAAQDKKDLAEYRNTAKKLREESAKRMVLELGPVTYIGSK